mmetsp:Transcript_30282/g.46356  ORF Transcript_30282/g.46356 Transcript_30282/m.46356 type:complete len:417 (+) Transcript_30282:144-1394(+)
MKKCLGKWNNLLCLCLFQVFVFGVHIHASSVHVPILAASIKKRPSSLALGGRRFPSILGFTITRLEKEEKESKKGTWIDVEYDSTTTTDENSDDNIAGDDDDMFESTEDHYEIDDGYYDDDEYCEDYGVKGSKRKRRQRQRQRQQYKEQKESVDPVAVEEEHPMRTDEWLIKVNMSPFLIRSRKRELELFPGGNGSGSGTSGSSEYSSSELDSSDLKMKGKGKEQLMKFARNGYVVLIEDGDGDHNNNNSNDEDSENIEDGNKNNKSSSSSSQSRVTKIGKWKVDTAGVSWHIPVRKISTANSSLASSSASASSSSSSSSTTTTLHYHADLILTKFQERPRMFRGVVCRDRYDDIDIHIPFPFLPTPIIRIRIRKNVFRPVIATFTAEGIGVDTADTLYKNRGFGLSSPPPTPSQK